MPASQDQSQNSGAGQRAVIVRALQTIHKGATAKPRALGAINTLASSLREA